ncbi:MAG: signal recognition particle-docking protein FtsY [Ruminococcaceae bacterium]|nr:signal recognition particle-docking protein FtsY [Oscillospiraceae bacterium]
MFSQRKKRRHRTLDKAKNIRYNIRESEEEYMEEQKEKRGFFSRLKEGLTKTRESLSQHVDNVFKAFVKVDEELFEELMDALVLADMGAETAMEIVDDLRDRVKTKRITDGQEVKSELADLIAEKLGEETPTLELSGSPAVIFVIGVNGVGKTTTIGKIASQLEKSGKRVLLAAADTFRAAAISQLEVWADRVGCEIVKGGEGADPASVVYDACTAAKKRNVDVLICDTAGRLHNKKNLMDELAKMYRVIDRELPGASKESLLVLDATTGQNAVSQAELFDKAVPLTGLVLTKLDGTAKGGIVIAICTRLGIPVKFIGVGEGIDDLQAFSPAEFAAALFDFTKE